MDENPLKMAVEYLDIVDENNVVVGSDTRAAIHEKKLRHRSIHIVIVNDLGQILLQKRSKHKPNSPGKWDTSVAGHVDSGATYEDAAVRELKEELGIQGELTFFDTVDATEENGLEFTKCYVCKHNGPFTLQETEVACVEFLDCETIKTEITEQLRDYTKSFKLVFEKYVQWKQGDN